MCFCLLYVLFKPPSDKKDSLSHANTKQHKNSNGQQFTCLKAIGAVNTNSNMISSPPFIEIPQNIWSSVEKQENMKRAALWSSASDLPLLLRPVQWPLTWECGLSCPDVYHTVPPPTASCIDTRSKAVVTLDQRRRLRKEAEVNYKNRPWHPSRELYDVVSQMR